MVVSQVGLQILQSAVVLGVSPLYSGVMARAEAVVASKRGPSIWQPYRDLRKLLRKSSAVSDQASWVFRAAPFVAFSCYLTVSAIVPVITDEPLPLAFLADLIGGAFVLALAGFVMSLAGLDTASPLGGLRVQPRQLGGQPGRTRADPGVLHRRRGIGLGQPVPDEPRGGLLALCHRAADAPAGLVAFFLLVLVEGARIPIDNPSGSTEISMIEEGRALEFSGRAYALVKWGSWMKLFLLSSIFMNVFVLPWGLAAADDLPGGLLATVVLLGKLAICGLAIVVIDCSFAKLRFFRIAEFLAASFLLALVGVVTSYVIGS